MAARTAEQISDDTGLPLVDVLDMEGTWDCDDEMEEALSADDFSDVDRYEPAEPPEWTWAEILNDNDPREFPVEKP